MRKKWKKCDDDDDGDGYGAQSVIDVLLTNSYDRQIECVCVPTIAAYVFWPNLKAMRVRLLFSHSPKLLRIKLDVVALTGKMNMSLHFVHTYFPIFPKNLTWKKSEHKIRIKPMYIRTLRMATN